MSDFFIYFGLGVMLLSACFGIYTAIIGYRESRKEQNAPKRFNFGMDKQPLQPRMLKLIRVWAIGMIIGLALTVIGICVSL